MYMSKEVDLSKTLFPSDQIRARTDSILSDRLDASRQWVNENGVGPNPDISNMRAELSRFEFDRPQDLDSLLEWTVSGMEQGMLHMTHRRNFGLFNPAPTFPSQCAERIVTTFNPQLAVWSHAPICVEIERHTIEKVAAQVGLGENAGGHFTTGGSEANYTALICALTSSCNDYGQEGILAFAGRPTVYASRESHLAWLKIAHQAGIGRNAIRLVPTDGSGRMDAKALSEMIVQDKIAGLIPVMVVATAGTTNAGMIDPIPECAAIAGENKLWLHTDAAWAGALVASPRLRSALIGIELSDSVTIDAHKWFATSMGCGMFLSKHPGVLSQAFEVSTAYMPSNVVAVDPYVNSVQWSRRFLGLRFFLSLAAGGWAAYAQHVEHAKILVDRLARNLSASGWIIANNSPAAVLCIKPPSGSPDISKIVSRILASGQAWITKVSLEGEDVLRICVTNGETMESDIDALAELLNLYSLKSHPEIVAM